MKTPAFKIMNATERKQIRGLFEVFGGFLELETSKRGLGTKLSAAQFQQSLFANYSATQRYMFFVIELSLTETSSDISNVPVKPMRANFFAFVTWSLIKWNIY